MDKGPTSGAPKLDDRVLRANLVNWLDGQSHPVGTSITQELSIPRPSVRADVVVTNGRFVGYEIKSDLDSWSRLTRQIRGYSAVFERAYLVTTSRRVEYAESTLPSWWGLIEIKPDLAVRTRRKSRINPNLELESLLYILDRKQLYEMTRDVGLKVRKSSRKADLICELVRTQTKAALIGRFREMMKR